MAANYFAFATQLAKRVREQMTDPDAAPCVRVVLRIGDASFPRCVADEFVVGRLSIVSIDSGYTMREYEPGTWKEATVYDCRGNVEYSFVAETPCPPVIPTAEQAERRIV